MIIPAANIQKKRGVKKGAQSALRGKVLMSKIFTCRCTPNAFKRYKELQESIKGEVLESKNDEI